jgi:hypothetical protein
MHVSIQADLPSKLPRTASHNPTLLTRAPTMTSTASVDPVELPTPPASSATASQHPSPLPQPRRRPLQPGGTKESELIRYLDHGVNQIQKRVDNRITNRKEKPPIDHADGYRAFWEVAKDLDGLVDVVWVSGSRMSIS